MKTVRIKIYKFKELKPAAKKVAIEEWRDNEDFYYVFDEAANTLKKFCDIFSIKIREFDFMETYRNQYTCDIEDNILELSGQRLATYIWNNYRSDIFKGKYYGKLVKTFKDGTPIPVSKEHPAGTRHVIHYSNCTLDNSCVLTGVCYDQSILDPIYSFLSKPDKVDFKYLLRDCLNSLCKAVQSEIKARSTDEAIADELEENDYDFTADGKQYP